MKADQHRSRAARIGSRLLSAIALVTAFAVAEDNATHLPPQSFPSAEAAVDALVSALRRDDPAALQVVLGDNAEPLISSGDAVADSNARARFVEQYDFAHALVPDGSERFTLEIGEDAWPSPVPLVKVGDHWIFDTDTGIDEMVYRRIGRNELGAIEVCRGVFDAQMDYAAEGRDGQPAGIYARRLVSDPGKRNGLYWPTESDEAASPLGPYIAAASADGYDTSKPTPYHGYLYRMLTAQGVAATGGSRDYLQDGYMKGGFAFIAYPVEYQSSGVQTFMISHDGVLYQKDLGSDTANAAAAIRAFDPDPSWTRVE
jgi:hypothetical protein